MRRSGCVAQRFAAGLAAAMACAAATAAPPAGTAPDHAAPDYTATLRAIALEIAALKPAYPQLAAFDAQRIDASVPSLSYAFHTHAAAPGAGWSSGVPQPDADGVWFYLDFHDPASTAQIHTQPVIAAQCFGARRVSLLILEGRATRPLEAELQDILRHHGVGRCERPRHPSDPTARIS